VSRDDFLSRWSRRKLAAKAAPQPPSAEAIVPATPSVTPPPAPAEAQPQRAESAPLPPVESLTPESDFTPFMKAEVDGATRRATLKTLFTDPRFNVMDGLDVYIDDFSKADPLPEGWLEKMYQSTRLGDFRMQEPENAQALAETPETPQLAEKDAEEQALVPSSAAGLADTDNTVSSPPPVRES
jgi:Protein of unknown function (DUF3306)